MGEESGGLSSRGGIIECRAVGFSCALHSIIPFAPANPWAQPALSEA